jgi:MFS transporter, ACS family, tartrate transporter
MPLHPNLAERYGALFSIYGVGDNEVTIRNGYLFSIYGVGGHEMMLRTKSLIAERHGLLRGWQWVFISEAIPALILSVVTWFYMTEALWLEPDEREWLVARQEAEVRQREAAHSMSVLQVLRNPRVIALGIAGFGIAYEIYGMTYFLPQIVKQSELTNMQTGLVSAIPFAVGACGMVWYGRRSDRVMERRSHTAVTFLIASAGLVLTALTPNPYVRLFMLSFASFGIFAVLPVFRSMPTAFLSGAARRPAWPISIP